MYYNRGSQPIHIFQMALSAGMFETMRICPLMGKFSIYYYYYDYYDYDD